MEMKQAARVAKLETVLATLQKQGVTPVEVMAYAVIKDMEEFVAEYNADPNNAESQATVPGELEALFDDGDEMAGQALKMYNEFHPEEK